MKGHLGLPLLGALAGFASYLLFEYADDWERPAWIVAVAFLMISSSATGLLAHALGLSVAVVRAIALAIVSRVFSRLRDRHFALGSRWD